MKYSLLYINFLSSMLSEFKEIAKEYKISTSPFFNYHQATKNWFLDLEVNSAVVSDETLKKVMEKMNLYIAVLKEKNLNLKNISITIGWGGKSTTPPIGVVFAQFSAEGLDYESWRQMLGEVEVIALTKGKDKYIIKSPIQLETIVVKLKNIATKFEAEEFKEGKYYSCETNPSGCIVKMTVPNETKDEALLQLRAVAPEAQLACEISRSIISLPLPRINRSMINSAETRQGVANHPGSGDGHTLRSKADFESLEKDIGDPIVLALESGFFSTRELEQKLLKEQQKEQQKLLEEKQKLSEEEQRLLGVIKKLSEEKQELETLKTEIGNAISQHTKAIEALKSTLKVALLSKNGLDGNLSELRKQEADTNKQLQAISIKIHQLEANLPRVQKKPEGGGFGLR